MHVPPLEGDGEASARGESADGMGRVRAVHQRLSLARARLELSAVGQVEELATREAGRVGEEEESGESRLLVDVPAEREGGACTRVT